MPRNYALTWQPGSNSRGGRWKKKYKGKVYYFEGGRGKTDRVAYTAAIDAWHVKKAELDAGALRPHQLNYEKTIDEWEQVLSWSNRHGDQAMAQTAYRILELLRRRLDAPVLTPIQPKEKFDAQFDMPTIQLPDSMAEDAAAALASGSVNLAALMELSKADRLRLNAEMDGSPNRIAREVWHDRLETQQCRAAATADTLRAHIELFVTQKQQQLEVGEVTSGRLYAIRLHLGHFQDYLGGDTAVREIDSNVLIRYRTFLLEMVKAKTWTLSTARHYLVTLKAFMRWLWQIEAIPSLPRVLDVKSELLKISTPLPDVVVFTFDEVKQLLSQASDRTKLYILLMLNCALTQKDIADLLVEEIDWQSGRIIRKRSKTSSHKNVPRVNYQLWPETLRLLQQERSQNTTGLLLLNNNGGPLLTEELEASGAYRKTDNVKNAFDRLRQKLKLKKSLKSLKKTSATLIRGNERFQGLEGLFLGHAPQSVSDKHYAQVPQELLDEALRWLGTQYGVV